MKKLLFFPLALLFLSGTLETSHLSSAVSIHDLKVTNQMNITTQTNGGYNQGSITLVLDNASKGKRVLIPMGTRFTSALSDEQDLIVPEDIYVDVPRNGTKKVILDAYCMQHNNLSPSSDQVFGFKQEKDENLMKVLNFMKDKGYSASTVQDAIWAVTDGLDVAGIPSNDSKNRDLREFICTTTGMKNVWYDLDREYQQTETREIVTETKQVSGDIAYEVKQTGSIVLQVTEEDGSVIRELGGGMAVTRKGNYKFNFNMKVKGWDTGVYFVQLKLGNTVFHKVAFEV